MGEFSVLHVTMVAVTKGFVCRLYRTPISIKTVKGFQDGVKQIAQGFLADGADDVFCFLDGISQPFAGFGKNAGQA